MKNNTQSLHSNLLKQQGSVLFISLVILLLLTIIGLSAMNNSQTELKLASNKQERQLATEQSQSGVDTVICLSKTENNNPLDKTYSMINIDGSSPIDLFTWTYGVYDTQNLNPFSPAPDPDTTCSVNQIDASIRVAIRRSPDGKSLRAENASSYDEINCQNYVADSRYQFANSNTSAATLAGICREKINYN